LHPILKIILQLKLLMRLKICIYHC